VIHVTLDGEHHQLPLEKDHRHAGASFDRFGVFNLQAGGHHVEFYLDELLYTGKRSK
jgi:hypothetical protein